MVKSPVNCRTVQEGSEEHQCNHYGICTRRELRPWKRAGERSARVRLKSAREGDRREVWGEALRKERESLLLSSRVTHNEGPVINQQINSRKKKPARRLRLPAKTTGPVIPFLVIRDKGPEIKRRLCLWARELREPPQMSTSSAKTNRTFSFDNIHIIPGDSLAITFHFLLFVSLVCFEGRQELIE